MRSVRRSRLAVPILAVLTAALAFVPTAPATFPGANGNIAFTSERNGNPEIYTVPPGGGVQTRRTELASDDNAPAWNAAGTEIAFSSNRGVDSLGDFEIYRMLADGTNVSAVTTNTVDDSSPAWAPGGAELVVVRHELGDTELVIVPADGSGAGTSLTGPIASISGPVEPDWSASDRIAFAAIPSGGTQRDIFTINPDGTALTNVTNTPARDEREPSWSPDAAQIAYAGVDGSNYRIHRIGANGTGDFVVTVTTEQYDDRQPAWSPDGANIAYASRSFESTPTEDIFREPAAGGFRASLTAIVGPDIDPSWQPVEGPACSDGLDNDGDGHIDYINDTGCTSASDNIEENACVDGADNDGDGHIDYPGDPGCNSSSDTDEFNPVTACSDGFDNDGDDLIDYPDDPGCSSATDTSEAESQGSGPFVRPKHAGILSLSLVPAFNACTNPNRQHGPPLAFPSCNPPVHSSNSVTIGSTDANGANENSVGRLKIMAAIGAPGPPDNADIITTLMVTDVRCKGATTTCGNANSVDGPDYTGALQASATIRITDRFNAIAAGGGSDGATLVDIPFPIPTSCVNSSSTAIGAQCSNTTSFNAIVPMAIRERKRTNIEVGQVFLNDGGTDGNTSTAPNTTFMKQGVFVP